MGNKFFELFVLLCLVISAPLILGFAIIFLIEIVGLVVWKIEGAIASRRHDKLLNEWRAQIAMDRVKNVTADLFKEKRANELKKYKENNNEP